MSRDAHNQSSQPGSLRRSNSARWFPVIAVAAILMFTALIQVWMGRPLICECGTVKLWIGAADTSDNSQHLADWYSFSHIIHGFGFYLLLWLVFKRIRFGVRLAFAAVLEAVWEIIENSSYLIDRYREATVSSEYHGDSIINSASDIGFMLFGFWLAARLPVWVTILLTILMEIVVALVIRDNLTLNILMLLFPVQAILRWQQGG